MAEEYDVIVVGAGHNGMCTAAYLQRAGRRVLMLERRHEEGGGVNTEEPVVPGFYHNMHAQYMEFIDVMPFYWDFDLESLGARMVKPEAQAGIAFSDGRPPIVVHTLEALDRTHASVARYSKADADTYCDLYRKTHYAGSPGRGDAVEMNAGFVMGSGIYSPPPKDAPPGGAAMGPIVEAMMAAVGLDPYLAMKTPKVVIDELFESPEFRTLMYRVCIEWGLPIDEAGGGMGVLFACFAMPGTWYISVGGTHTLAKAMKQACLREGVTFRENSKVEKILVGSDGVEGVRIRGGEEFRARVVASNANLRDTLWDMVGPEHLSELWRRRVKNFRFGPSHVLGTTAWALWEPPRYKSARWDPEIDRCSYTVVGFDDPTEMIRYIRQAYGGWVPDNPGAGTWVNTLWDKTQAPPGRHSLTGWFFMPSADELSAAEWEDVRRTYNDRFLARFAAYAPNMTRDNVIGDKLYVPPDMEEKNRMINGDFSSGELSGDQGALVRPFPEAHRYATEIPGLYLCGPSAYPGGGVHAAAGYNAMKVIVEDLGLPQVWEREGRTY